MSDLIERDKAYEAIASYFDQIGYSRRYAKALIDKVPSARPKGRWIRVSADKYVQHAHHFYRCSFCREDVIGKHNFCPNCGADMRKESE